jgi:transposase-like protein
MKSLDKTLGFCPLCRQNVEHTRMFSSSITRFLDLLTFGILKSLRVGPYYCFQCESKCYYLKPFRRDVPTFDSITMTSGFHVQGEPWSQEESQYYDATSKILDTPEGSPIEILPAESLGNLFKTEQSLVMQERRSNSYSLRFRDSIVARILQGEATLASVKKELNVKEGDLIRWISDLMDRKQKELDQIREILQSVENQLPESIQSSLRSAQWSVPDELEGIVVNRPLEEY